MNNKKEVLQPKAPRPAIRQNMVGQIVHFEAPAGHYHLVEVDDNGTEIPGTDFSVIPLTYERSFKTNPKFTVKKNPK